MSILTVRALKKRYPAFSLGPLSFDIAPGKITGLIGKNGAGKTTTLKCLIDLVHPDAGEISFFDLPFLPHQKEIKSRIGFVFGGVSYYPMKKLSAIAGVTRSFYPNWDQEAYLRYCDRFSLDQNKTPATLSAGMRVKFALALALSHKAELLILDEPTSGLDPVSRDDLIDVFLTLCDEGTTILFSTHITSDLDACADRILYIQNGNVMADADMKPFVDGYRVVALTVDEANDPRLAPRLIGLKRAKEGMTALITKEEAVALGLVAAPAGLNDVMIHFEKAVE